MNNGHKTAQRLTAGIITVIVLVLCLAVTTYALVYATVQIENNVFQTGSVSINLNDGKPVISEHEYLFEPGMTVEKPFFVENESTWSVYYKVYFDNVQGGLADVLEITVKDGDEVLWTGTAGELTRANVAAADDMLQIGERRDLTISFYFPRESGNAAENMTLVFDLCAEAVQTKNNPDKLFD